MIQWYTHIANHHNVKELLLTLCCLFIACFFAPRVRAQDSLYNRNIYFELGGSAGVGSFNYEHSLIEKEWYQLRWSAGLSVFPSDKNNGIVFVIPTLLHWLVGKTESKAEIGIGQALSVTTKASGFSMLTPFIGYRYQHPRYRWIYRVTYTPIISYLVQYQYQHWFGLSVGYQW